MIKVGCCGWASAHRKYFQSFEIIEIQGTFYQPPVKDSTVEGWRENAPEDFEFTLKCWQLITHHSSSSTYRKLSTKIPKEKKKRYGFFKTTPEVMKSWSRMDQVAQILGTKIILFQTPASFDPSPKHKKNLKKFFNKIDRKNYTFVWEPRGKWNKEEIKKICKDLKLVHGVDPFKSRSVYGKINYFRLHGKPGYNLRYEYTNQDLKRLRKLCDKKRNYVLFNNLSMRKDAQRFKRLL